MKSFCIQLLLLFATCHVLAETIVTGSGVTYQVAVSSNEVMRVRNSDAIYFDLIIEGVTSEVQGRLGSLVAGPCVVNLHDREILVKGELVNSRVFSYDILNIGGVKTLTLISNEQHTVNVPEAKCIVIGPYAEDQGDILITKNGATSNLRFGYLRSSETVLDGPLDVTFIGETLYPDFPLRNLYSYYLSDKTYDLSGLGLIKGPLGSFEVVLEESPDGMSDWHPLLVHQKPASETNAFYRVRITE